MVKGSTESNRPNLKAHAVALVALATLLLVGMASGLWIHVGVMVVTVGIFMATVTMHRSASPATGGSGAKVIPIGPAEMSALEDLDEVA